MLIAINHPYSEERLVNFGLITNAINLSAHILTADTTQFMILGMVYYVFYCFTDIIFLPILVHKCLRKMINCPKRVVLSLPMEFNRFHHGNEPLL
jgi:hypothetical protein